MKNLITLFLFTLMVGVIALAQNTDEQTILKLEEDFRAAKINNDVPTLQRVLADNFYEVNWRGEGSPRAVILQIFTNSKGRTIELSDLKVQVTGDSATVRGYQHETRPGMDAYIQFMHFCVRQQGQWRLLAVQQMMDYREGTRTPQGWSNQSNHLYAIGSDTKIKRSGQASVLLKSKMAQAGRDDALGILQRIKANDYCGKRIRLTGYTKGENLGGLALPWMRVDSAEGVSLSFDNTQGGDFVVFSEDWSKFEIVLDVPEDGFVIFMGLILVGKGRVWADDWLLEIVGKDVPSTHMASSEANLKELEKNRASQTAYIAAQKVRQPSLPAAPVNLDFETAGKP